MKHNAQKQQIADDGSTTENRYLIFRVGQESLAAPLLSVREIVEPLAYRPAPNPYNYYLGLANLRGQVVGVIDLGTRLGLEAVEGSEGGAFLIFESGGTSMAGFVNRVECVTVIPEEAVSRDCNLDMKFPVQSLQGVAQLGQRIVPIVDLSALLETPSSN